MLKIINLGLKDYNYVWELQKSLQKKLIDNDPDDYLIVCSHPQVITLGRSSDKNNILASKEELDKQHINIIKIERGGDVTWHGPEQIILYPILNLNRHKRDVAWYLRNLEEVVIRTLNNLDIKTKRVEGDTGVWIDTNENRRKISSLGVRISRWCTLHGLSLNVLNCQNSFNLINPCGFSDILSTSVLSELPKTTNNLANSETLEQNLYNSTKESMINNFLTVFNYNDYKYEPSKEEN